MVGVDVLPRGIDPQETATNETRRLCVPLAFLICLVVAMRLAHLAVVAPTPLMEFHREFVDSDMWFFEQWRERIVSGDWLGREVFHPLAAWQVQAAPEQKWKEWYGTAPTFYKAPFYAYFVALVSLVGLPVEAVFAVQALVAAASAWLIHRITTALFDERAGLIAVAFFAFYGPDIHYTTVFLRGPFIVVTSLLVTERLLSFFERRTRTDAALLGSSMALALLVNEAASPVPVLVALTLFVVGLPRPTALLGVRWLAFGLSLGILPVILRNLAVGAPAFELAVTGSVVLAVFNSAAADPLAFSPRPETFAPIMDIAGTSLFSVLAACLASFPSGGSFLSFYLTKAAGLIAPFEHPDNLNYYYATSVNPWLGFLPGYALLLPLALLGLVLAVRDGRPFFRGWLPVAVALVAAMMLTLPLSRYRAVFAVYLIPLLGGAVRALFVRHRERRFGAIGGSLAFVLTIAAVAGLVDARVIHVGKPAAIRLYRPQEFVLAARIEARRGSLEGAARELERLAILNPDPDIRRQAIGLADAYRAGRQPAAPPS